MPRVQNRPSRYAELLDEARRDILRRALLLNGGNRSAAARALGLERTAFLGMLARNGLQDYARGTGFRSPTAV